MTVVLDSSVVLAALTSQDYVGQWARDLLASEELASCHHLPVEVAGVLRRRELAHEIAPEVAAIMHAQLMTFDFDLHPYEAFASRIWQLRQTVTVSDAWYVALAEALDAHLATIDYRLTRAPGPRCEFLTPPSR